MALENLPIWTTPPNWRQTVTERLEALTAIMGSPSGAEQRYAARWSPRRTFEATMSPVGRLRTQFDLAVGSVGGMPWYLPVWHDVQHLAASFNAGSTTLSVDTAYRDFRVGRYVVFTDGGFRSEVAEVTSISPGTLTLADPIAATWPAGTRVYPAVKARLTEMPGMNRVGSRVLENLVRFEVEEDNDYSDDNVSLPFPVYDDLLVLTTRPDEGEDLTHGRQRLMDEIDGEVGLRRRFDTAGIDFTLQRHQWLASGRQQRAELRTLFYTLDGRRALLWLPTFADDFDLVVPATAADSEIEVAECGFTAFGGPRETRRDVWIALRDGTNIFRRITGSSLTGNGTEIIVLDDTLDSDLTPANVLRISFMAVSRLDADVMEFVHHTDGVSRSALNFRSVPDIRVGSEWSPVEPTNTAMTDDPCGVIFCVPSIMAYGAAFQIGTSDPGTGGNIARIAIQHGTGGSDFYVAYTNGSSGGIRAVYVDSGGTPSSEATITSSAPASNAVTMNGELALTLGYVEDLSAYRLVVSDGESLFALNDSTLAIEETHVPVSSGTIVSVSVGAGHSFRVSTVDAGTSVGFADWSVGDPSATPTPFSTENYDKTDGVYVPALVSTHVVLSHDADTLRLSVSLVKFFTADAIGPVFLADSAGADERHITAGYSNIFPSRIDVAWRAITGGGPSGSVRLRSIYDFDPVDAGADTQVYSLVGLGVSGYTHLANREPVCGLLLTNSNLLLVERRYETVGAQLRAYEVLVLHAPYETQRVSNVVRLTGIGPTGDVKRSAALLLEGKTDFEATVVVVFEAPPNSAGGTVLMAQRFIITTCSRLDEPE